MATPVESSQASPSLSAGLESIPLGSPLGSLLCQASAAFLTDDGVWARQGDTGAHAKQMPPAEQSQAYRAHATAQGPKRQIALLADVG
jgi:hypothetical protein